jgi:hypothetical protein
LRFLPVEIARPVSRRRIVSFYRERRIIEQLFRTLKTRGFDVEASRVLQKVRLRKLSPRALFVKVCQVSPFISYVDGPAWQ